MYKKLLSLLLVFLVTISVVVNSEAAIENLSLDHLSVDDGLSQGSIYSMMQDKTGYIWLSTTSGVNIYDGNKVRQLSGPDNSFENVAIYDVIEDHNGVIWLNVDGRKLYSYNPKTDKYQDIQFKVTQEDDYYIANLIYNNNKIWILTSKTLGFYDFLTKEYRQVLNLEPELVGDLTLFQMALNDGVIYIGSRVGAFTYNIETMQWKKLPLIQLSQTDDKVNNANNKKIFTLKVSHETLYLGTGDGLFSLNVNNMKDYIKGESQLSNYELLIENVATWQILFDKELLYLASDKGLYSLNTISKKSEFLFGFSDYFDNISDNNITALIKDHLGDFWLGSNAVGAYKWNPNKELVKNYSHKKNDPASLSYNEVWHAMPDSNKSDFLWVATSNGLNFIELAKQRVSSFLINEDSKSLFTKSHIYSLWPFTSEQMFISTAQGIYLFDKNIKEIIPLPFSDEVNKLLKMEQFDLFKQDDFLWLVNGEGIYKVNLETNHVDTLTEVSTQFPPERLLYFLGPLPNSDWFLMSSNDGLWGANVNTREFKQVYKDEGILKGEFVAIDNWAIDKKNILWLSFSGKGLIGLSLSDFNEEYYYHKANSIIDNNVYGVLADKAGDIWFSSHNGIFMLDSESHHISHFTRKNGLGATEFNSRAYTKLNDGRFVYGSMEGVSLFDPLKLKKVQAEANDSFNVNVTAVDLLSRKLTLPLIIEDNATINLKYDDVGIRIEVSTFSFGDERSILYKYKLSGENDIAYPPSRDPYINFPSLESGNHTLSIQAKSPYTGAYSEPVNINFKVTFAPWRSPIALFFYCLLFIGLMSAWYHFRKKQQQLLLEAHEQVKYRENRLQLALTGSNSEVWDWQADENLMFGKRISFDLGYLEEALFYSFDEHIALVHPEDFDDFMCRWQLFINSANLNDNFTCTYRLKTANEEWLWFKDLGKIVAIDSNNKPTRVTGSYTNVTDSRAKEERAQYYGDAFQQTKDWVLIIDEKISKVTANHSVRTVFNWPEEEFYFTENTLGLSKKHQRFYKNLMLSLKEGEDWRGDELINAGNEEYHVIINITVGRNSVSNALHYLFVLTDISAQKSAENELRILANYDHLTGLPNRSLLLERIKHAIEHSHRHRKSLALFFIDLDRFKQVNDSLGHDNGDILLQETTKRLEAVLRIDDTVARIGGDEFVVLLENFSNNNQLSKIAEKIIAAIEKPVGIDKNLVSVGASIGISVFPDDGNNSDELLRHADVAMYHAKNAGKGTFKFYTAQMNIEAMARLSKESALKLAVKNNEFINHYQPIVDAHTGKAVGVEMLMRWQTATGLVSPDEFIPLSEELNLIIMMTELALERACEDLKKWLKHRPNFYVSINLSVQHFVKIDLAKSMSELLTRYKLPSNVLRVEVTESTLISEPENAITTMQQLSALGIVLALDDFGTGFSSLSYLKKLPLDIIKIDRSFVSGIGLNDADEAIVDTTLVLAKRLKMHCIAEGVETIEQLNYLTANECHYIQGYFYGKPMPAKDILQKLVLDKEEITSKSD